MKLAIDPGKGGAIAVFLDNDEFYTVLDMPLDDEGFVDCAKITQICSVHSVSTAVLEKVGGVGKQSASRSFNFGRDFGRLEAAIIGAGVTVHYMAPQTWKGRMGLIKQDKSASIAVAKRLLPDRIDLFKRAKDHGRAEAFLIGVAAFKGGLPK